MKKTSSKQLDTKKYIKTTSGSTSLSLKSEAEIHI